MSAEIYWSHALDGWCWRCVPCELDKRINAPSGIAQRSAAAHNAEHHQPSEQELEV